MKFIGRMIALSIATFPTASVAQAVDCQSIADPSSRLKCYDRADAKSTSNSDTGSVEGTITWQYNNYVGTKGDTGAIVVLIRQPLAENLAKVEKYHYSGLPVRVALPYDGVIYRAEADGYGHYTLPDVPSGKYLAIVISNKTRILNDDAQTTYCKSQLAPFISDARFFNKAYCRDVSIEAGKAIRISHDFGNTGF